MRLSFEVVPNRDRLQAVLEDRVDVAIAGVTLTPDRMRLVRFSPPYYLDGTGILVPGGDEVPELADLRLSRIGLLQGSSAHFLFAVCAPPGRPGSPRQVTRKPTQG